MVNLYHLPSLCQEVLHLYSLLPFICSVPNILHLVRSLFAGTPQLYIIYFLPKCRFMLVFLLLLIFNELQIIFTFLNIKQKEGVDELEAVKS